MRRLAAAIILAATLAGSANAQDIQRYVNRAKKVQAVTPDDRFPVTNGPNSDVQSALSSKRYSQTSQGTSVAKPSVLYSVAITLAQGEGGGRLMIWDAATVPAPGALGPADLPTRCIFVDPGDRTAIFASTSGIGMARGISWAFSTSGNCHTLTPVSVDFVAVSFEEGTNQ